MRYVFVGLTLAAFGCAGAKTSGGPNHQGAGGNGAAGTGGGAGTPGNSDAAGGTGNAGPGTGGDAVGGTGGDTTHPLAGTITTDVGSTLTVTGRPTDVHLTVSLDDGTKPPATWSVDDVTIGSVNANGVFRANGFVGGIATVTARVGSGQATAQITVTVDVVDGATALPAADQDILKAGGAGGDAAFKWLYPYDGTVFPRGLAAPSLQFASAAAQSTYLKITAPLFSYQQFAAAAEPLRVSIPDAVWRGLTLTAGPKEAVSVSVTKLAGGAATGPLKQSWLIAQAGMKGIIYYNTYNSPKSGTAIMRVQAGGSAEVVVSGCTVCHSVSASGNVLAAGSNNQQDELGDWNPADSQTFNLTTVGTPTPRGQSTEGRTFSFMALTPDGRLGLVNGLPPRRWPPFISRGVYSSLGTPSTLVDTASGADVPAPSLRSFVTYATTPAFSPDGAHVAFVNGDRLGAMCVDPGCGPDCLKMCDRVLTMLDFDGGASPPSFSNPRDLVTQGGAGKAVAWPAFLPDAKAVLYHQGDSFDSYVFTGDPTPSLPQHAELRMVEVESKTVKALNALNGRLPTGDLYLPFGDATEGSLNYEPTVLPVAVGGYYWVLFTSRRVYGNTISPGSTAPPGADAFGTGAVPSPRKKIWIAAIDIDHAGKDDPSHPAFYLPGQELESGNMRAFAALAPCKPNGAACESGADCCGGFCRETARAADGTPTLACVPPPLNACSNTLELCKTSTECCNPAQLCINNRCSMIIP